MMSEREKWLRPELYFDLDEVGRKYYEMLGSNRLVDEPLFPKKLPGPRATKFKLILEAFERIYVRDRGWVYSSKDDEALRIPKASRLPENSRLQVEHWVVDGETALYGGRNIDVGPLVMVRGPHYIGEGSVLHSSAKVCGPGYYAERAQIGSGAEGRNSFVLDEFTAHVGVFFEHIKAGRRVTLHARVRITSTPIGRSGTMRIPVYENGEKIREIVYAQSPAGVLLLPGSDEAGKPRQTRVGAVLGDRTIIHPGALLYPPVFIRRSPEGEEPPIVPPDVKLFPGCYDAKSLRRLFAADFEAHQL